MSGLDIEAIRARAAAAADVELFITRGAMSDDAPLGAAQVDITPGGARALWLSSRDVPALLEQIERDRAALDEAVASVREQAAEIERLRAELARTRAALGNVREHLDLRDSELVSANSQRDHARAALADALQVLADLRGGTP